MKDKQKILKEYIDFKQTSVKSTPKLKDIEKYINDFISSSKKNLDKFEEKDLIKHLNQIDKRFSISSLNSIKPLIKHFIKWKFEDYSSRFRNLDKLCRTQKAPKTYQPEQMLSKEDIEKIVQAEHEFSWKVYFLTLYYSGSRPSEICNLKWKDVTFEKEGAFIKIYSEKNKEYFDKFIPEDVAYQLKKLRTNNSEWVFPSILTERKGKPITSKAVYHRLKNLSLKALGKKVNPYVLRHSIATTLYNNDNIPDDDVAKQMGHSKNMKRVYNNLDENGIKERARRIWIKPEDLPEQKKHELEKKIEELEKRIAILEYIKPTSSEHEILKKIEMKRK